MSSFVSDSFSAGLVSGEITSAAVRSSCPVMRLA